MGTMEIELNEPIGQFFVEHIGIAVPVSHPDELLLERAIEPLADSIVLRCPDAAPPVLDVELPRRQIEGRVEFRSIVRLDVHHLTTDEQMQFPEKVRCRKGAVARVHAGESET